eukprot:g3117.t1
MLISYTKGEFPEEYVPTIFDNYEATVQTSNGGSVTLNLWDTAGQEDYDHIRNLAYKDVDVFIVCFSLESHASFANVKQKWVPSITESESASAQIVLVGTKSDLRTSKKRTLLGKAPPITAEDGKGLASEIGAAAYVECSALLGTGLKECMQKAVDASISSSRAQQGADGPIGCCTVQ